MKVLLYIAFILPLGVFSQGEVGYIFEDLTQDSLEKRTVKLHTTMKPFIRQKGFSENYMKATGLADINASYSDGVQYKTGLGAEFSGLYKDKWYYRLAAVQGISDFDSIYTPKTYIRNLVDTPYLYTDIRARVSYTPNHIFNFQAGIDQNFIGEGSRSLLLSDYGTAHPFAQIRANFWRFEYAVIYQFLRERRNNAWQNKFMSTHHISFNPASWLNIGIFEAVIFQPKDTTLNRGFEVEYLNPFVFYRPQEYSIGSSDNVLLGMELNGYIGDHTIYSQFILDEFFLAELRAKSGWWANKFGGQLGVKGRFNFLGQRWFYRTEYNFVRPFTFAHINQTLNYGTQGTSLAHPYGGNFMEVLGELKWGKDKWNVRLFANYYVRGADRDGYSFGGDIYQSYTFREDDFGHYIGQGMQLNGANLMLIVSYKVLNFGNMHAFIENHFRHVGQLNSSNYMLVGGIRSYLWNDYRNY